MTVVVLEAGGGRPPAHSTHGLGSTGLAFLMKFVDSSPVRILMPFPYCPLTACLLATRSLWPTIRLIFTCCKVNCNYLFLIIQL